MDKDMERLGKERLKRVRRRRQLATFIISMAVIVLGITAYRLIQPASAADQNQRDFTIDNVTENYVNLQKLQSEGSYTEMSSEGKSADWNGEKFKLEVQLDFGIGKNDTVDANGNTIKNYYYVYDPSVTIPDDLCNSWTTKCDDNSDIEQFKYRYIKNEDGTYAILIRFADGYIEGKSSDIEGWAKVEALGEGKTNDSGDLDIVIDGDVTITVDKDNVHWNGNDSLNYDISVKKSNTNNNNIAIDENGNYYVEFTVDVSSEKGTPDDIEITDEFNGNGMRVDTTGLTYSIKKNGQAADNSYTATITSKDNPADAGKATLTARLPKLDGGESCSITYRYYLTNAAELNNKATWQATNFVTGKSTDQNSKETVIDTSSSYVKYYKNLIEKYGKYDKTNNRIIWTVTVNKSCEDIAGAVLTDDMFDKITGIEILPSDGYTINKDSSDKVTSVTFNPTDGNKNCNKYTVKYYTDALQTFDDQKFNNKATLTKDDKSYDDSSIVNVPKTKQDVTKKLVNAQKTDDSLYTLKWEAKFTIPASGFPKEFGIADTMSSKSQKNYHYMTYAQMNDFVSQVKNEFDGYIGDITVKYLDKNNRSKTAKLSEVSESDNYRFTSVNISFDKDYPTSNSEKTVVFTYSTTADTTAHGRLEYVNKFEALNSSASASYSHTTSKIVKTDGNGNTGQTYLKTTESDGTLTWRVDVLMDADATEYTITDKLPEGVTLQSVKIMLAYTNQEGFTYPDFNGKSYTVSAGDWFIKGIQTSTTLDESTNTVVTSVIKPDNTTINGWQENSHIYVVYKCTIDDFENFEAGKKVDYKNKATASSNTNSDMGWVHQTQTMTKPNESGSDNPTEGDKVISKNYKWDEDNHRLRYTVIINPDGKDYLPDSDTLKLTDVLKFTTRTYGNGIQTLWYIDLMPATVQFREAIKQSDGTYKPGEKIDECKWNYSTQDGTYDWSADSYRTIKADIPDGKAIMLTYTYQVNAQVLGTPGEYSPIIMNVSNTAKLEGIEKGEDRKDNNTVYKESKSSAGVIKSNTFTLYKVDKADYGRLLKGAEFELFGYTSDGSYTSLGEYTTDENGRIDISMSTDNLEYNTQYYIVETKAPDGYLLSAEPHKEYFYFSADTSAHPVVAENSSLQGSNMAKVNTPYYYEDVAVSTTSISVDKKWIDSKNNPLDKTDGKIYLQLHQVDSADNDKKYGNPVELTADSAGEWSYVFDNLPLQSVDENGILTGTTYKYYVTEVGINQNNSMSGYDVSYVFKDINGTQITKTDANVAPGSANAIESGTVEITNKLIEYELPETGGSGNRWLYMLSGVVLILISAIALFYKKQKTF